MAPPLQSKKRGIAATTGANNSRALPARMAPDTSDIVPPGTRPAKSPPREIFDLLIGIPAFILLAPILMVRAYLSRDRSGASLAIPQSRTDASVKQIVIAESRAPAMFEAAYSVGQVRVETARSRQPRDTTKPNTAQRSTFGKSMRAI
ncbi:MAG: hypothetical protein ABSA49_04680 [Rhizomicrobium sp.]